MIGLFFIKTKRKYYIQSGVTIIVATLFIFFHIYLGYAMVKQQEHTLAIARRVICSANVRQIDSACLAYQEKNQMWPDKENWCDNIQQYFEDNKYFICYTDKIGPCSYAMNENIPVDIEELPDDLVLLFESVPGWNTVGGADDVVTDRHGKSGANIVFADGHVEFVEVEEIGNLRWTVEENCNAGTER